MPVCWSSSRPGQPWMREGRLRAVSGSERKPDGRSDNWSSARARWALDVDAVVAEGAVEGVVAGVEGAEVLGGAEIGGVAVRAFERPQPVRAAVVMAAARPVA